MDKPGDERLGRRLLCYSFPPSLLLLPEARDGRFAVRDGDSLWVFFFFFDAVCAASQPCTCVARLTALGFA